MGKLLDGYLMPHPPVVVPDVGRGRDRQAAATVEAMKRAAREIGKAKPTTVILSSPHAPCFRDYVYIPGEEMLEGDFGAFGSPEPRYSYRNNCKLAAAIAEHAKTSGIAAGDLEQSQKNHFGINDRIDHGALVPLCFLEKELPEFRLVLLSTPFLSFAELYEFGKCVRRAIEDSEETVIYIASGDLSHRLTPDAPAGYTPKGKEYDESLVEKIRNADVKGLLETDLGLLEKAGECGTRSIVMMLGALDGMKLSPEIYSYEGPFGVGYLIAKMGAAVYEGKEL